MMDFQFDEATHTYTLDGKRIPSVTQIIGTIDPVVETPEVIEAGIRGTICHDACEYHDRGELDESAVDPSYLGHVHGWQKFRAECPFEIHEIELAFAHAKHQYAGRIDRVVGLGKYGLQRSILDIKTGAERAVHRLQLAAYKEGYEHMTGNKIKQSGCVYLRENGTYSVKWHNDPNDLYDFLAMLRVARWKERNNK